MHILKNIVKKGMKMKVQKAIINLKKLVATILYQLKNLYLSGNKSFNYLVLIYCSSLVCNLVDLYKL